MTKKYIIMNKKLINNNNNTYSINKKRMDIETKITKKNKSTKIKNDLDLDEEAKLEKELNEIIKSKKNDKILLGGDNTKTIKKTNKTIVKQTKKNISDSESSDEEIKEKKEKKVYRSVSVKKSKEIDNEDNKEKKIKRSKKTKKENDEEDDDDDDNKKLKPLIKWSGGKSDEIKTFEKHIPENYDTYLEPFIGGGSVFFNQFPNKAVISDVHKELIDFYQAIKDGKAKDIYKFMETHPNDEKTYYEVRDDMEVKTPLDNAKRFYYLRKTCFRGMMRYNKNGKFNIPYGKYKTINYEELLNEDYEKLLKNTKIFNKSYEYIFKNHNDEKNFMFLDPPYDSEFTDYGYCKFDKEEQEKLAKCFKETKIKCLMIIGKTEFISKLYKGYIVEEYEKNYRFKLYAGRVGDEINTKHLVIKNYK
jgi:DNA adenine methylase